MKSMQSTYMHANYLTSDNT